MVPVFVLIYWQDQCLESIKAKKKNKKKVPLIIWIFKLIHFDWFWIPKVCAFPIYFSKLVNRKAHPGKQLIFRNGFRMYKENGSKIHNCSNRKQFYIGYKQYAYPTSVQKIFDVNYWDYLLDLKHFMKVAVVHFPWSSVLQDFGKLTKYFMRYQWLPLGKKHI